MSSRAVFFRKDVSFGTNEKLENVILNIVSRVNRTVNEANPIVDARLLDGSRVNVVLPPIALDGPTVTIRKFPEDPHDCAEAHRLRLHYAGGGGSFWSAW